MVRPLGLCPLMKEEMIHDIRNKVQILWKNTQILVLDTPQSHKKTQTLYLETAKTWNDKSSMKILPHILRTHQSHVGYKKNLGHEFKSDITFLASA